ncbi:hypothetical protein LXA43DRAFT_356730 [Ganoderma leucocontextum]|nr:hypothetical protein LXA43DRAFT_356730 [Ganoderma leucocontextum]
MRRSKTKRVAEAARAWRGLCGRRWSRRHGADTPCAMGMTVSEANTHGSGSGSGLATTLFLPSDTAHIPACCVVTNKYRLRSPLVCHSHTAVAVVSAQEDMEAGSEVEADSSWAVFISPSQTLPSVPCVIPTLKTSVFSWASRRPSYVRRRPFLPSLQPVSAEAVLNPFQVCTSGHGTSAACGEIRAIMSALAFNPPSKKIGQAHHLLNLLWAPVSCCSSPRSATAT